MDTGKRLMLVLVLVVGITSSLALAPSLYGNDNNFALAKSDSSNNNVKDDNRESEPVPSGLAEKIEKGSKRAEESKGKSTYGLKNMEGKEPLITALPSVKVEEASNERRSGTPNPHPLRVSAWDFDTDVLVPPSGISLEAEPDIIASEVTGTNLVAVYSDFSSGLNQCRLANTFTDGASWTDRGFMVVPGGTSFHSDPVLATNSRGHFIAVCLAFDFDSSAIIMQVSTNGGNKWRSPSVVAGTTGINTPKFYDKPWVGSDPNLQSPFKDRTYMCYTLFDDSVGTSKIMVKRIQNPLDADDGIALATGAELTTDVVQGCNVAVGPEGEVAVTWYQAFPTDPSIEGRIMLSRSYNGGDVWTTPKSVATFIKIPPCSIGFFGCLDGIAGQFRVNQFPDIAWDSSGGLHVTYVSMSLTTLADVMYTATFNCGLHSPSVSAASVPSVPVHAACTFVRPIRVNNEALARDQFFPSIIISHNDEVNEKDIVLIVVQDKREDPTNTSWRPWSYSCQLPGCNAAARWASNQVPVSRSLFSNTSSPIDFFVGDYNGLTSSSNKKAYAIWFDNVDGMTDIYSDRTRK